MEIGEPKENDVFLVQNLDLGLDAVDTILHSRSLIHGFKT